MPSSPPLLRLNPKLALLGLSLIVVLSGCGGAGGGWHSPPPVVDATTVSQRPWVIQYTATGTLEALNKVELNTETAGNITQILVREGERVTRGQVLLRLKADRQLAQVQESAAGIASSEGTLEQRSAGIKQAQARAKSAEYAMKLAESEFQRYQRLFHDDFVSQLELEQKQTAYNTSVAAYHEALEGLVSAKASYNQASSTLAQAKSSYRYNLAVAGESLIRAPFTGVVGQKYVDLGDYVAPTEKLLTVVDSSSFKIEFPVPERYLGDLKLNLPVQVHFEGLGNSVFQGRVNFIDPVVDRSAHTVTVKALLPASQQLKHGLFGTVKLALGTIPTAVVIPEEAIVPQGEKTFVYVVRHEVYQPKVVSEEGEQPAKTPQHVEKTDTKPSDVAHLQEVMVGYREAGLAQIQSGLHPGERIVVNGLQKVSDNLQVQLSRPAESTAGKSKGY